MTDVAPAPRPPSALTPLYGGLLIGGRSSRMGQPKQLIELHGVTFAERVARALQPHVQQLVVLGSGPLPTSLAGRPRLDDVAHVAGPLAGILAGLRARPGAAWLIAACDMPLITLDAIVWLLDQRSAQYVAVLPRIGDHGVEPLLAVYEPTVLPMVEERVAQGRFGAQRLREHAAVFTPRPPAQLVGSWTNVNDAAQLAGLAELDDKQA